MIFPWDEHLYICCDCGSVHWKQEYLKHTKTNTKLSITKCFNCSRRNWRPYINPYPWDSFGNDSTYDADNVPVYPVFWYVDFWYVDSSGA